MKEYKIENWFDEIDDPDKFINELIDDVVPLEDYVEIFYEEQFTR